MVKKLEEPVVHKAEAPKRVVTQRMRMTLGQPVIIENIGGAEGTIAVGRSARAAWESPSPAQTPVHLPLYPPEPGS